jgi:hypothetical protein
MSRRTSIGNQISISPCAKFLRPVQFPYRSPCLQLLGKQLKLVGRLLFRPVLDIVTSSSSVVNLTRADDDLTFGTEKLFQCTVVHPSPSPAAAAVRLHQMRNSASPISKFNLKPQAKLSINHQSYYINHLRQWPVFDFD